MATILLVGENLTDQDNLAAKLRVRGHAVLLADSRQFPTMCKDARMSSVEIFVFDVTHFDDASERHVRAICQQPRLDGRPALVLCYSRTYRSPRFELDIERLGARFVYAE
jgi:hypothetical protein